MKVILLLGVLVLLETASAQNNSVKMADAINNFGLHVYKKLALNNSNLICSGYSIATSLNMLLPGARFNTEQELRSVLGHIAVGLDKQQALRSYHDILTKQREHRGYELSISNDLLIQAGFPVLLQYSNTIRDEFYGETTGLNFGSPVATKQANSRIANHTKNKIANFFDSRIDESTKLILASALYFKGIWKTKFNEDTKLYPFGNSTSKKLIQFMNVTDSFPYYLSEELNVQVLELPYAGNDTCMFMVLPRDTPGDITGLPELEHVLNMETLKLFQRNVRATRVQVKIPKFVSNSSLQLDSVLKSLGMTISFTEHANFSGIALPVNHRGLFVSKTLQKAVIEVNEDGVVSASASAMLVKRQVGRSESPTKVSFTADGPFLYFIWHRPTGVILFMGRMTAA